MKFEIRQRDKRALIFLVCASVLYVLVTQIALPAFDRLNAAAETAADNENVLRKYRRAVIRKGHYTQLLEQARQNLREAETKLIPGANQSLASVELQNIVEEAARKSGINLAQRNISPAKKKDNFFNEIMMTVSFDCSPTQLTGFLAELRSTPRFVTVTNAQITPTQVLHAVPKTDEFRKIVRVNLSIAAILSNTPPAAPAASAGARTG